MTTEEIIINLKEALTPSRFAHTMGVAQTARELALIHGFCPHSAYTAGLLHDCAKCMTKSELEESIQKYGIVLDSVSADSPQLWHSFVGAYAARDVYGVEDEQILRAIYYHTIGREGMTPLEKIIYLADAIEPSRSYSGVDELRRLARTSLDKAVFEYTRESIAFIKEKGAMVHPNAYKVLEFYRR